MKKDKDKPSKVIGLKSARADRATRARAGLWKDIIEPAKVGAVVLVVLTGFGYLFIGGPLA